VKKRARTTAEMGEGRFDGDPPLRPDVFLLKKYNRTGKGPTNISMIKPLKKKGEMKRKREKSERLARNEGKR